MDRSAIQALLRQGIAAAKAAQQQANSTDRRPTKAGIEQRERARELLIRVTELDEQNIPAWLWLSTVVETREEKQTCLENVLILDPDNKHARTGLARLEKAATAPDPTPAPARPTRSKYTRLKPKPTSPSAAPAQPAATTAGCPFCRQSISALDTTCPHCRLPLVMSCPECGTGVDVEQAICAQCRQPMGNYRRSLDYFARLGAAYREKERHPEAVIAWQAVEALQPDYPHLQLRLSEAHLGMGRPDRASTSLQQALAEEPDAAEAHYALAELRRQRGEQEQAFESYQTVTRLDPQHGLAWFQLGRIYQQARRRKEAMQALRRAAKLLPADSTERRQIQMHLAQLSPGLPEGMATGWSELIRQTTGPMTLCILAVLLDSGLRPWWIPFSGWLALALAVIGTVLAVSGASLPRNPVARLLAGGPGLSSRELKITFALVGLLLWLFALALILLPLGQSFPDIPQS